MRSTRVWVVAALILAVALGAWQSCRQPAFDGESIITVPVVTPSSENRRAFQAESVEAV